MIDIINRQRKIKIDCRIIQEFAENLRLQVFETNGKDFTIAFVSDRKMKGLNRFFRGKDKTTDVLSFPNEPDEFEFMSETPSDIFLGEIVISAEQAQRQAAENNLDFENEVKQLILHGVLHLCGYDHETDSGEMNARELALRDKLQIN